MVEMQSPTIDRPARYPSDLESHFHSHTGEAVWIRPIVPSDAPRLQHLFTTLSTESIYRRFFTYRRQLSDEEAQTLATVDYETALALVAVTPQRSDALIGVARFARTEERKYAVEMAIVVADAWQGHGIGRRLFASLARAAQGLGYHWMLAETQMDNQPMIDLAEHAGFPIERQREDDSLKLWLDLSPRANA